MTRRKKLLIFILFTLLAVLLFPFTALWAIAAGIAGWNFPIVALKGGDFEEDLAKHLNKKKEKPSS